MRSRVIRPATPRAGVGDAPQRPRRDFGPGQEASGRLAKIGHLADLLRRAGPDEIGIAVSYLSGEVRQGRIGVGYAALRDAAGDAGIGAVADARRGRRAARPDHGDARRWLRGGAAPAARRRCSDAATETEQEFLFLLLIGELRQGALEGVMVEAIARAAGLPAAEVRRAVMLSGDLPPVARSGARRRVAAASAGSPIEVFRPLRPMLAQTAEDAGEALARSSARRGSSTSSTARGCRSTRPATEVRIFTRELNDVTAAVPEIVEAVAALPARQPDPRRRGDRAPAGRHAAAVPGDDAPLRAEARRRRRCAATLPLSALFFDCLLSRRRRPDRPAAGRARRGAGRGAAARAARAAPRDRRRRGGAARSSRRRSRAATRA